MAKKPAVGCKRPSAKVQKPPEETTQPETVTEKKEHAMIQIGQKAPDFAAPAYYNNEFTTIQLSDFQGKWVVLCFYPGDFTFV